MTITQITPIPLANQELERLECFTQTAFPIGYFDDRTVGFLNSLSAQILKNVALRSLPAFVALAYWLRKSNIESLRQMEQQQLGNKQTIIRQPLGTVFHVCPSNVDTIFLYSLAISLLAGNKNILRVSNRMDSPAIDALFNIINETISTTNEGIFSAYIHVISYGHDAAINQYISLRADARIIWGGNRTVQLFKGFTTSPRCRDIAFPDRLSCSIIKAESLLQQDAENLKETCRLLYNDAYVFDQLGCSSPQILFFLGDVDTCNAASEILYHGLHNWAAEKYQSDPAALASLKLNTLTNDAIENRIDDCKRTSNLLVFAQLKQVPDTALHSCGGGYFYTKDITNLSELQPFISKTIQTVGYFGLNQNDLSQLSKMAAGKGLDRIVPIGQALAFNNYWDGYHLLEQLTHLQYLQQ